MCVPFPPRMLLLLCIVLQNLKSLINVQKAVRDVTSEGIKNEDKKGTGKDENRDKREESTYDLGSRFAITVCISVKKHNKFLAAANITDTSVWHFQISDKYQEWMDKFPLQKYFPRTLPMLFASRYHTIINIGKAVNSEDLDCKLLY